MQQQPHRPGPLHQTNKPHKVSKHSRKSSVTSEIKNKTVVSSSGSIAAKSRSERLNLAAQSRKIKWEKTISDKRSPGSGSQPPLNVGILGEATNFIKGLREASKTFTLKDIRERCVYVASSRLKMRCKLTTLTHENFDETLDLVKTLDLLILIHKPDDIDRDKPIPEMNMLSTIYIHCLPTIVHVIDGFERENCSTAMMLNVKRRLKAKVGDDKMHAIETSQDYTQLLHIVSNCKRQRSNFKESRPVVSSDTVEIVDGRLAFTGFVRNKTLNPNDLIHISSYDDYQISKIDILPDVVSLRLQSLKQGQIVQTLVPDPMRQESLEQENELDPMEGEQTWPTAEELAAEAERRNTKKIVKKLPPGTSEYQGAWIAESDEDDEDGQYEDVELQPEDKMDDGESMQTSDDEEGDDEEGDDLEVDMDEDESDAGVAGVRFAKQTKADDDDEQEDDEVDTPTDVPARVRFARYRGLKSFRTSEWDPQENLPPDYSRIFQFRNFHQTKKRVMSEESHDGANPGLYVRVQLSNVPQDVMQKILAKPVAPSLIGLLRHERKMTVMNLLVKRSPESRGTIKSKDELIFYVGFRKFKARPLFTNHCISTKFKYERTFQHDVAMVATIYAPVTFPPAPVLVFQQKANGAKELVASGSVLDSNPNRLIIKRAQLTGHPYKIHSKSAVLRYMFHNSEDVLYFKPVELVTKYNRRGHIGEPIGTHGHMKCTFNKKIRSDDCVFMNLYKRVFPKWTYAPLCE